MSARSLLNNKIVFLSVACIQLILNSVITAKFLKLKTSKFDPKAYVAMTVVVTAMAVMSLLILRYLRPKNEAKIIIGVLLLGLMIEYVAHSTFVIFKLRKQLDGSKGLIALCSLNLVFTFSILCYSLVCVYRAYNSITVENVDTNFTELMKEIDYCIEHNITNDTVTKKIKEIFDDVTNGKFKNYNAEISPKLQKMIESINEFTANASLKNAQLILKISKAINNFMSDMTLENYERIQTLQYVQNSTDSTRKLIEEFEANFLKKYKSDIEEENKKIEEMKIIIRNRQQFT